MQISREAFLKNYYKITLHAGIFRGADKGSLTPLLMVTNSSAREATIYHGLGTNNIVM